MFKDFKNKTPQELRKIVSDYTDKAYLAEYIFSFIHLKNISSISEITPLSLAFRKQLGSDGYYISQLKIIDKLQDQDGTVKFLFELPDGNKIESVLLTDNSRKTVCVSTQVGCRMGCEFCATGLINFRRNLNAGEIADQVNQAAYLSDRITNVVYMGMGEPMDNLQEVIRSIQIVNEPAGRNIGQRHITISTCGITEGIESLAEQKLQVRLAVSLHAPNDSIRTKFMASAKKYPISKLIQSLRIYQKKTKRRITFEYCMIDNLNDSPAHANATAKLVAPLKANINLIEYNPHDGCDFRPSSPKKIEKFAAILSDAGIETNIRYKRGQKIKAACGQLGSTLLSTVELSD